MKGKIVFVLVAALLILALGIQLGLCKQEEKAVSDTAEIMRKLDEVLANQAETLKELDEIKQELAIIKVRASR